MRAQESVSDFNLNTLSAHQILNLFDIKEDDVLFDALKRFIEKLYFGHLAINPKDRKVIIAESIFCTLLFKKVLLKVLYEYFNVSLIASKRWPV